MISKALRICSDCIKRKPEETLAVIKRVHAESRIGFGMPPEPPRDPNGVRCRLCANECNIPEGGMGYCGLKKNGTFFVTAGKYQPEAAQVLARTNPPEFVAAIGKPGIYTAKEGNLLTSIRAESIQVVDADTR